MCRYAAKKLTMSSLPNSAGWIDRPANLIQLRAPFTSDIEAGSTAGSAIRISPASAEMYA